MILSFLANLNGPTGPGGSSVEFSPDLSNSRLDAIETVVGASPILEIRTGSHPATLATADSGTLLSSMTLPSDWMAAASAGVKAKSGTWNDASGDATGTPGHWRIKTSGAVAKIQGTAGIGSGELSFDAGISLGGSVTITGFTLTDGNLDA